MNENISLGEAFRYCSSFTSYWVVIAIPLVVLIIGFIVSEKYGKKNDVNVGPFKMILGAICVLGLAAAIFISPTNVQANTSKDMAKRGSYIGR